MKAYRRVLFRPRYFPLYVAFILFIILAAICARVVVYDASRHFSSARALSQAFYEAEFDLARVRSGEAQVPRIFIKSLPKDFNMVESPAEKKELFIKFLLPLILKANEDVMRERERFIALCDLDGVSGEDKEWLDFMRGMYKTEGGSKVEILAKLDEVPVSMALAQAIQETGWGESRFLIDGNAIFAEWTWGGQGMRPRARANGLRHRVKTFSSLEESVASYVNNLNRTRYYAGFRRMRAKLRDSGKPLSGSVLASAMLHYSTQKDAYILGVKKIIRDNKLHEFDNARLEEAGQ